MSSPSWDESALHVFEELKRQGRRIDDMMQAQREIEKSVVQIQTRCALWGASAGTIIAMLFTLIQKAFF